ncbi:hypothetical protein CRYUN_Cryun08bG0000800 [Craigia yunnanensis]
MTLLFLYLNHGLHVEVNGQGEAGDENARNANKKALVAPAAKPEVPGPGGNAGEPDGTDSDEIQCEFKFHAWLL